MRSRAHAPQVTLVGVDELGLRAIGHDGLTVEADAGEDRVHGLGAYTALDGARTDLTQERRECGRLCRGVRLRLLDLRACTDLDRHDCDREPNCGSHERSLALDRCG